MAYGDGDRRQRFLPVQRRTHRANPPVPVNVVALVCYVYALICLIEATALLILLVRMLLGWVDVFSDGGKVHDVGGLLLVLGFSIAAPVVITAVFLCLALLMVFGAIFFAVVGRRLQRGRRWARVVVLLLATLAIGWNVYQGWQRGSFGHTNGLLLVVVELIIPTAIVVLFSTSAARHWFQKQPPHREKLPIPSSPQLSLADGQAPP